MKRILTSFALVAASVAFSQVSIAPSEVAPKATLDIEAIGGSTPDGILIPRVTTAVAQSMPQPETSTLVYIKADQITVGGGNRTTDVDGAGFYYFDGAKWVKLGGTATPQTWSDFRTAPDGVVTLTNGGDNIPSTAFFVIADINGNVDIKLPDATNLSDGKMVTVFKGGTNGKLSVQDKDGKVGGASGSQLIGDGGIRVNFGKTFIVANNKWYPTTF